MKRMNRLSELLAEGEEYHETFLCFPISAPKTMAVIFALFAFVLALMEPL